MSENEQSEISKPLTDEQLWGVPALELPLAPTETEKKLIDEGMELYDQCIEIMAKESPTDDS